ncbi:MAG: hypothetical protein P8Y28_12280 [Gammaproteobacteria bacterium]|jgi:hypothetical protein
MSQLRCDEVKNSLIDYLEFELPLTRREHFYEHLAHCVSCQAMHDELQQVLLEVKKVDLVEPPQSYWEELPENVLREIRTVQSSGSLVPARDDEKSGVDKQVLPGEGNVIAFTRANKRVSGLKIIEDVEKPRNNIENNLDQPSPIKQAKRNSKPGDASWPKVSFSIAAALLLGLATTLFLLEKEPTILQDHIGFQAQIQSDQSLAQLAQSLSPLSQSGNQLGFASQQKVFNEFAIGSMFSEAKAYAKSGEMAPLKTHLALLETALQNEVNPQYNINHRISQLQQQLIVGINMSDVNQALTGLLNAYASSVRDKDLQRYELFKAGVWLFDYALAALAEDSNSIKQVSQLSSLTMALEKSEAPPGVINSLNKIRGIAQQSSLTSRDYQQIVKEVENIRSLLG